MKPIIIPTESARELLHLLRLTQHITDQTRLELETGLTLVDLEWETVSSAHWQAPFAQLLPCGCQSTQDEAAAWADHCRELTDSVARLKIDGFIGQTDLIVLSAGISLLDIEMELVRAPQSLDLLQEA